LFFSSLGRRTMSSIGTKYEHIVLDNGVPVVSGTTMKVVELVAEKLAYGWSPEELHFQHPYITLGQIHSALAYYWDHTAELEHDMELRLQLAENVKQANRPSPLVARLKSKG